MTYPRAQFLATVEEVHEVGKLFAEKKVPFLSIIIGLCLLIGFLIGLGNSTPLLVRIPLALIVGIGGGLLWEKLQTKFHQTQIDEKHNKGKEIECIFELRPEGLWVRRDGIERAHNWAEVQGVEESDEDVIVDLLMGIAVIRKRAFASKEDKDSFIRILENYISVNSPK